METVVYEDPKKCRSIWEAIWPVRGVFDLWQVRACFLNSFSRPVFFHTVEQNGKILGFLPLCWVEESGCYVLFPGEIWKGKTWLEQNQLIARNPKVIRTLLESVPGPFSLRYLSWTPLLDCLDQTRQDEVGYLFFPRAFNYSMENYWSAYPGKSRKKLRKELAKLEEQGVSFKFNRKTDIETLFMMNLNSFGKDSYFSDPRFYQAFERLAGFLWDKGMLRITSVFVGDRLAAVDMGVIFKNNYTLLAGGTDPEFAGVAKLINLHHLEWSCKQKFDSVDFLCGDFNWKERFRLTPRPLYEIKMDKTISSAHGNTYGKKVVCA